MVAPELCLGGQRVTHAGALSCDDPPQAPRCLQQALPRSAPSDGTPQLTSRLWKAQHCPVAEYTMIHVEAAKTMVPSHTYRQVKLSIDDGRRVSQQPQHAMHVSENT